ncbi:AraC family transcriptional regulator [Mangrovicella endophytica]|uniref:AraC family transcriptional regulator n=1 Tax=Mangrovicella endophytica TaxID=2066697 RepID=UPI000C9DB0AA|nr:AraC family transcriptional regulator [Mangrovicella endophytica]
MDPLSDVLSLLEPRNYMSAGFDAGGSWAIRFPDQQASIKCGTVVTGRCLVSVEGIPDAVLLRPGDCFLLPHGRTFTLASDADAEPVAAGATFASVREGGIVSHQGGGDCFIVSSRFALLGEHAAGLLRTLPPIVHIPAEAGEANEGALRWPVERMMQELRQPRPGGTLVMQHLAHMMLIEALRLHLTEGPAAGRGWLFALADRRLSRALTAIHAEPARRWTLGVLAERAGLSRSSFAERFKTVVGKAPMEYVTQWRMLLAARRLRDRSEPVSAIALSLGYESESAFSTAFKREMGISPRHYGREAEAVDRAATEADALALV